MSAGFKVEVVTRWKKGDQGVVSSPGYGLGFAIRPGGSFPSKEAAVSSAISRLESLLDQKYRLCVRRLKPTVPDKLEQRRRMEKYLNRLGVSQLMHHKLGREAWPKLARAMLR